MLASQVVYIGYMFNEINGYVKQNILNDRDIEKKRNKNLS